MKNSSVILIFLSFFVFGCATSSMSPVAKPSELANGNIGVKLQLGKSADVAEGSVVSAFNEKCTYRSGGRDRMDKRACRKDNVGYGKVIYVTPEKLATVEFERGTLLSEDTLFELSKDTTK